MTRLLTFLLTLSLVAAATGCGDTSTKKTSDSGGGTAHAPAGATPGSHEDWCAEHNVAESACTRCDPSLIAAFKATNDWCPEHGLPESQCLQCNPNLKIVRPPKSEGK